MVGKFFSCHDVAHPMRMVFEGTGYWPLNTCSALWRDVPSVKDISVFHLVGRRVFGPLAAPII